MSRAVPIASPRWGPSSRSERANHGRFAIELRWTCLGSLVDPAARPGAECELVLRCTLSCEPEEAAGVAQLLLIDASGSTTSSDERLVGRIERIGNWQSLRLHASSGWRLDLCFRSHGRGALPYVRCDLPTRLGLGGGRYGMARGKISRLRVVARTGAPSVRGGQPDGRLR